MLISRDVLLHFDKQIKAKKQTDAIEKLSILDYKYIRECLNIRVTGLFVSLIKC